MHRLTQWHSLTDAALELHACARQPRRTLRPREAEMQRWQQEEIQERRRHQQQGARNWRLVA
jgi:hypothetical protein